MKIYFAAPLFSVAERNFNKEVVNRLEKHFDVFLPQRDGGLFVDLVADGFTIEEASHAIFATDSEAICACDVIIAVLDGRTVDEGVAVELGLAFGLGKECIGLQTDPRRLLTVGNNPMIENTLSDIFHSVEEMLTAMRVLASGTTRKSRVHDELAAPH